MEWLNGLLRYSQHGQACVLATVAETRGSAPREAGAKMVVAGDACIGTIGGGQLEYQTVECARGLLTAKLADEQRTTLRRFALGATLGQCCGGVATVFLERIDSSALGWLAHLQGVVQRHESAVLITPVDGESVTSNVVVVEQCQGGVPQTLRPESLRIARRMLEKGDGTVLKRLKTPDGESQRVLFDPVRPAEFHVVLFGAGHVGSALLPILAGLGCTVTWVDSRADQFPPTVPDGVRVVRRDDPQFEADCAPRGSYYLVMTHSHPLDYAICERVLRRRDVRYCGLIGSRSKRLKFEKRLRAQGFGLAELSGLTCPIGIDGINGKRPGEIAVAVAAELLQMQTSIDKTCDDSDYARA
jgi:xanthine dehydrogenase accessory factor